MGVFERLLDDLDAEVSLYPSAECFQVFVVGAVAGRSLYFHGGTASVTKAVALPYETNTDASSADHPHQLRFAG